MSKQLYAMDPTTGRILRNDGVSWIAISSAPANWTVETSNGDRRSSCGQVFTWRGKLYARYYARDASPRVRVVPLVLSGVDFTATFDTANQIAATGSGATVCWTNIVHYRGFVVWLEWTTASDVANVWVFGDFGSGPALQSYALSIPSGWTSPHRTAEAVVGPHGNGYLFVHDTALFWAPTGLLGRHPSRIPVRAFRFDPRTAGAGVQVLNAVDANGWIPSDYWGNNTLGNSTAQFLGFRDGIVTAGTVNGKLFYLRPNLTVDVVDDFNGTTTRVFDIRDQAWFTIGSFTTATPDSPAQAKLADGTVLDGTIRPLILGGRVTFGLLQYDIAGGYDADNPAGGLNLALRDMDSGNEVAPIPAGETITITYGACGTHRNSGGLGMDGRAGSPVSAMSVEHEGFAYMVVGFASNSSNAVFPSMTLVKWDGTAAPQYLRLNAGGDYEVNSVWMYVDRDANILHISFQDTATGALRHRIVNLATFTEGTGSVVASLASATSFPSAVKSGFATGFTLFEPFAQIDAQTYSPVTKRVTITSRLFSESPTPLTGVSMSVSYNTGAGWEPATVHASSSPLAGLTASQTGEPHTFVHDLAADEPSYVGPIQYRITTFIP